ncbi:PepSY domain-containing protein [Paucibacter sp. PLA-PC-4]|uniref:PepSY domain-containing protein n=1 Tax=Paucibacter sp. PLA-PC-4 TaxID=2993655 RepID=UPI00224904CA|nr:PepSY domain-containing protein [Paucibacter sp. PLA-PC-4]MCX2863162.1 PepSY domain-containing protein [Paucibacter sp. PLA-PC-4]
MKRWLHLLHRWLGIALGLLILLWLISGLVMLFVARPALHERERLQALAALPAEPPPVSAAQAWAALALAGAPEGLRLQQQLGRPVWLLQAGQTWHAVDGLTGQRRPPLTVAQARALAIEQAQRLSGRTFAVAEVELLQRDQWSVYGRFNAQRPLYRVALADADEGLELYIGQGSGELVLDTRAWERGWNWLGTVTHWLYFTPLRANGGLWRGVVLWSSGAALALVLLGLVLGVQRLRLRGRYASGSVSPYRWRWQRWHHLLGLGGGLVLLTWLFSGWLSMAPWGWPGGERAAAGEQQRWRGGALQPGSLVLPLSVPDGVGELAAQRLQGQHLWLASAPAGSLLLDMQGQVLPQGLDEARLRAAAAGLQPAARIVEAGWLRQPDLHYYSLRHQTRAFPVYRVAFDDAAGSVYYLEPRTARVALRVDQAGRWNRWLFNALHRWDFPPLAASVLVRDVVVTGLSSLGVALSLTGCVLAWRRLQSSGRRNERKPS